MVRDVRTRRDLHALDDDGMVLCNPRDREAAHRAETEGIATDDPSAVTCRACLDLLHRRAREERSRDGDPVPGERPAAFVRVRAPAGSTPRKEAIAGGTGRKPDHGRERLARQILEALQLSSVLSSAGLDGFAFVGVVPGGRAGHFVVDVARVDPGAAVDPAGVERVLGEWRPRIRAEVARAVHRRKAPEMTFRVRLPDPGPR